MDYLPAPSSTAPPPIILITDYTQSPILTTHYHHGPNVLTFHTIYASIRSLKTHPGCPHRTTDDHWPCPPCSASFLSAYWSALASLLDYFTDFRLHDSSLMSALWFHLLDIWQESRSWLPLAMYVSAPPSSAEVAACVSAARGFVADYCMALGLVERVLYGREEMERLREEVVHEPSGGKKWYNKRWNTGPFVSGLRPWEQFLRAGSPGVVGFAELETRAKEKGMGEVRYVPQAAVAIMQMHTERARKIAAKLATSEGEDGQIDVDTEFLARFDRHSLVFPSEADGKEFEYPSEDGTTTSYSLVNGAPPVERYRGYCDRDMVCEKPPFTLLDECVALCRGVEAYEPMSGDGDEVDDEDDLVPFDMWAVYQRRDEAKTRSLPVLGGRLMKDGA